MGSQDSPFNRAKVDGVQYGCAHWIEQRAAAELDRSSTADLATCQREGVNLHVAVNGNRRACSIVSRRRYWCGKGRQRHFGRTIERTQARRRVVGYKRDVGPALRVVPDSPRNDRRLRPGSSASDEIRWGRKKNSTLRRTRSAETFSTNGQHGSVLACDCGNGQRSSSGTWCHRNETLTLDRHRTHAFRRKCGAATGQQERAAA